MKKMGGLDWVVFILVIVGALNWGLVGLFKVDVVASILGDMSTAARVVYTLVGLSGLYMLMMAKKMKE